MEHKGAEWAYPGLTPERARHYQAKTCSEPLVCQCQNANSFQLVLRFPADDMILCGQPKEQHRDSKLVGVGSLRYGLRWFYSRALPTWLS